MSLRMKRLTKRASEQRRETLRGVALVGQGATVHMRLVKACTYLRWPWSNSPVLIVMEMIHRDFVTNTYELLRIAASAIANFRITTLGRVQLDSLS